MRRRKKRPVGQPSYASTQPGSDNLHIRLCHVCLHLNESDHPILLCQECSRYLTIEPLIEEKLARREEESDDEPDHQLTGGLNGLAVVW